MPRATASSDFKSTSLLCFAEKNAFHSIWRPMTKPVAEEIGIRFLRSVSDFIRRIWVLRNFPTNNVSKRVLWIWREIYKSVRGWLDIIAYFKSRTTVTSSNFICGFLAKYVRDILLYASQNSLTAVRNLPLSSVASSLESPPRSVCLCMLMKTASSVTCSKPRRFGEHMRPSSARGRLFRWLVIRDRGRGRKTRWGERKEIEREKRIGEWDILQ